MSSLEESDSPKSESAREEDPKQEGSSGDQNTVQGGATNGGFIFQGGQHQVEVTQYFGVQPPTKDLDFTNESIETEYFEPETILIPAGTFWIGSPRGAGIPNHETPQHEVKLPAYRIGKYPVTNSQYEEFIRQTGRPVVPGMGWDGQRVPQGFEDHPVTGVSWYEARAYCEWLSQKTGRRYSIPNEAQWEKACRGGNNSIYPWGDELDEKRSNHGGSSLARVDDYPPQNEYGCFDLVGNVRQWTTTLWGEKRITPDPKFAYPWRDDQRNDINASRQIRRVVRGSSMKDDVNLLRCSARSGQAPDDVGLPGARHGFRVLMSVQPTRG